MAVLARRQIVLVVASSIAPLDIWLGKGSKITCSRRQWMRLMAITALGNRLRILRIVRYVLVGSDLLSARSDIVARRRGEFIERSVAIQAHILGNCGGVC